MFNLIPTFHVYYYVHTIMRPFFLGDTIKYLPKPLENNRCLKEKYREISVNEVLNVSYFLYLVI